ncbi:hypothetical protein [Subtercola vilae]|uniref:Uncharacterized protein n=1 Tax=Subtercola vilae TaxID=2056433 RepID=A0A4T2BQ20_9MICO|nr:hypothetical protein [Subtercola vilae]TIH33783.1 hypothetical protein D4765_13955 [Subtercola vilae]
MNITLRLSTTVASYVHQFDNPLNNITPNFTFLGVKFTALWQLLLAGVWGIAIIVAIVYLIMALVAVRHARDNSNPQQAGSAKSKVIGSLGSLGGLVALPIIVGAIITVFS